jgi:sensor histidine kinase YesM
VRKSLFFWLTYAVAWLILAASHVSFFVTHLGKSYFDSVKGAFFNTAPAALFGIIVVLVCKRLPWSPSRRNLFLGVHLLLLSCYVVVWMIGSPLLNAIDQLVQHGRWNLNLTGIQGGLFTGSMLYLSMAGIVYSVQTHERLRIEEARATRAENLRTRAELAALRSQLNPHFLFNTLHSLMALVRHDPPAAEDALEKLSLLLRHTLVVKQDAEDCPLSEELDFIRNYLALEKIRLGDRLRLEEAIKPEALGCSLPPLTLQPLVENAVKHAIAARAQGGVLTIRAERANGLLVLEVSDDGPGAEEDHLEQSVGTGLKIARQRLMTRFGDRARFEVITQPQNGFAVRMEIPAD